jgi:hypothetical protein
MKICIDVDPDEGNGEHPLHSYSQTLGDGTSTSFTVNHNLHTSDLLYALRNTVTGEVDGFDVAISSPNQDSVALNFATAPAAGSVRVVLLAV